MVARPKSLWLTHRIAHYRISNQRPLGEPVEARLSWQGLPPLATISTPGRAQWHLEFEQRVEKPSTIQSSRYVGTDQQILKRYFGTAPQISKLRDERVEHQQPALASTRTSRCIKTSPPSAQKLRRSPLVLASPTTCIFRPHAAACAMR